MTVDTRASEQAAFVARQPILDGKQKTVGYELLFRGGIDSTGFDGDHETASASVLTQAILGHGLQSLTQGGAAFLNVTRALIVEGLPDLLQPDHIVLEITEDIEPDAEVIAACKRMRAAGFKLALDDFVLTEHTEQLIQFADYIKVDFLASDAGARRAIMAKCGPAVQLLAEKIEDVAAFDLARGEGFGLFQGYFFGRPIIKSGGTIPGHHLQAMRLLQGLQDPNLSAVQLEELIKSDVRMCYLVLRAANSAAAGVHSTVTSIRDAIVRVGRDAIRRWASMWLMARLGSSGHPELVAMAMTRAHCSEALSGRVGVESGDGFLVGLCSLLDAMLGRPMLELLAHLPLDADAHAALLGEDNTMRQLLDCIIATERGDWEASLARSERVGIAPDLLASSYHAALRAALEFHTDSDA